MLQSFTFYDLFILSFVQLVVCTVLVMTPARRLDTRLPLDRFTGHRGDPRRGRCGDGRGRVVCARLGALGPSHQGARDRCLPARGVLDHRDHGAARLRGRRQALLLLVCRGRIHVPNVRGDHRVESDTVDLRGAHCIAPATARPRRVPRVELQRQLRERRDGAYPPLAAAADRRPELSAVRVVAHPGIQRAARAVDRNDQGARGDRLPQFRDRRHRQQHEGSGDLRAGRGVLPGSRTREVRACRAVAGLQGRRMQPRAARVHGSRAPRSSASSTPTTS